MIFTKKYGGFYKGIIYDGVFWTILNDDRQMIILVINEIFKEDYTGGRGIQFELFGINSGNYIFICW